MKILIIGGTGLLGYHASLELLAHHHEVSILALPPAPAPGVFPENVAIRLQNLDALSDPELERLLHGNDVVIFAAGVDDRITPKAPAYPFFFKHNVQPVTRLAVVCGKSGIQKLIILGSYFAYFDRTWPEMQLKEHHPYIRSRVEQTRSAQAAALESLAVITLELPYIFGTMPGRTPLWKPLVKYAASPMPLFYTRGGTTCVTVKQVAQAIRGAVEVGQGGRCYPIGGVNLTWIELLEKIERFSGKNKRVITLPDWLVQVGTRFVKIIHKLQNRESGLDPVAFVQLQTQETFIDSTLSQELNYASGDLDRYLQETVAVCLQPDL